MLLIICEINLILTWSEDGLSANIKFLKTQLSKIVQLGGFLFGSSNIFGPLMPPIKGMKSITDSKANS